jgi:hypothetical protein
MARGGRPFFRLIRGKIHPQSRTKDDDEEEHDKEAAKFFLIVLVVVVVLGPPGEVSNRARRRGRAR